MDKTGAPIFITYQQKKGMTPKEINKDIVNIPAEESSSYITMKRWAVEFKSSRDSS